MWGSDGGVTVSAMGEIWGYLCAIGVAPIAAAPYLGIASPSALFRGEGQQSAFVLLSFCIMLRLRFPHALCLVISSLGLSWMTFAASSSLRADGSEHLAVSEFAPLPDWGPGVCGSAISAGSLDVLPQSDAPPPPHLHRLDFSARTHGHGHARFGYGVSTRKGIQSFVCAAAQGKYQRIHPPERSRVDSAEARSAEDCQSRSGEQATGFIGGKVPQFCSDFHRREYERITKQERT